jgi:hypothetical protein
MEKRKGSGFTGSLAESKRNDSKWQVGLLVEETEESSY